MSSPKKRVCQLPTTVATASVTARLTIVCVTRQTAVSGTDCGAGAKGGKGGLRAAGVHPCARVRLTTPRVHACV